MAVMVVSGTAAHPSNCTSLVLEIPTKHPQDLSWEAEIRRPSPDHRKADSVKGLSPSPEPRPQPLVLLLLLFHETSPSPSRFPRLSAELLHFYHRLRPTRDGTSAAGALKASHQRIGISAIGLSLMAFLGIKKNIVVQACCGQFPVCSTFSKNSTIFSSRFFCQVQKNLWVESFTSHPVFALYNLDAFSKSASFNLGNASS